jgi:hypothetical protein
MLILGALNPIKLTWGSPCIPRQIKNYGGGLRAAPKPPHKIILRNYKMWQIKAT